MKPKRIYKVYGKEVPREEFWRRRDAVDESQGTITFGKMWGFDIFQRQPDGTEKRVPQY